MATCLMAVGVMIGFVILWLMFVWSYVKVRLARQEVLKESTHPLDTSHLAWICGQSESHTYDALKG